jgi:hypothetical protein
MYSYNDTPQSGRDPREPANEMSRPAIAADLEGCRCCSVNARMVWALRQELAALQEVQR